MRKRLEKEIEKNIYFKFFFEEEFNTTVFDQVSPSELIKIILDAQSAFSGIKMGDLTEVYFANLHKAKAMLLDRLNKEKSTYILCSRKPKVPFLFPDEIKCLFLSVCINEKSAEFVRKEFRNEGYCCFEEKTEDLKNYIFSMCDILGSLSVDVYSENGVCVNIFLPNSYYFWPKDKETEKREDFCRTLIIYDEMFLFSKRIKYCYNESFRQEISKKLGKLVEETSFFVPVDKETKNTFPLIKTVAHGEALPIFTSYDLAKEMYSEDNYLVTPILLQWLKTLSGVSRFVINPNFQDFVFTYKEETKVVASDDNHYQNEC